MKLLDFLRTKTEVHELCAVRQCGYVISAEWIDSEDLFMVPDRIKDSEVIGDSYGHLSVTSAVNKVTIDMPCHFVDIEY